MKKLLCLILAIAMVLGTMSTVVFAEADVWDGTYPEDISQNGWIDISVVDDYKEGELYIKSAKEFAAFAQIVNAWDKTTNPFTNKTVYLEVDIDLNNYEWIPIGPAQPKEKNRFYGSFYGQGHTISNLNVAEGYYYAGLFGKVPTWTYSQVFDGITINNAKVASADNTANDKEGTGALLGGSTGAVVTDCHVTGAIEISGDKFVGGLIGDSYAQISDCTVKATGTITATGEAAGGLVGQQITTDGQAASVTNCAVIGDAGNELTVTSNLSKVGGAIGNVALENVTETTIDGITVMNVSVEAEVEDEEGGVAYIASGYVAENSVVANVFATLADAEVTPEDNASVSEAVAEIDGKGYPAIQAAINAAAVGDTITLLSDVDYDNVAYASGKTTSINIPKGKEFTLDLNGYTISGENSSPKSFELITINNGAVVTIDDTSAAQTGKITYEATREEPDGWIDRAHTIFNRGTLILDGGTIENATPESQEAVSSAVDNNCSWGNLGTFIMNGGVVTSAGYYAVRTDVNTHNTTANGTLKAVTEFNGGTVYGFYLMDRGSDLSKMPVNDVEVTVGDDAVVEPANYSYVNGVAIRIRYGKTSKVAVEVSEDAQINGTVTGAVAKVGGAYYKTLAEAVAVGGNIILLADATLESANIKADTAIDLNENTLTVNAGGISDSAAGNMAAIQAWADVAITNGNVVVSSAQKVSNGVFYVAARNDASLTIEDVNLTATNTNGTDVFVVCNPGTLSIINSTINASGVSKLINGGDGGNATITNSEINISDSDRAMVNIELTANDSDFTVSNLSDNAFRNVSGTINNTNIDANGYASGIKNDAGKTLAITGDSVITLTGATEYDLYLKGDATLTIEETATFEADNVLVEGENTVTGNVASKADSVSVKYVKADVDEAGVDNLEGKDIYEIVLEGANAEKINELASADLTFAFNGTAVTNGAMSYFVTPVEGVALTQLGDRFMFNYDGATKHEESDVEIVIGTITIDGYGTYTLATADATTNAVYATEIRNNIVEGFTPAATLITTDKVDATIAVPTRELTINIDFPNAVTDNAAAYQAMKVEITGTIDGVNQTVAYDLGKDGEYAMANGDYVVTEDRLVLNNAYTVTVSGAGYRTARYTVTMTEDKELNFWNNVMDEDRAVEGDVFATTKTFLAGDIVRDSNINVYDLSAVVSYFAKENNTEEYSDYAKYDLDRNGVIDSRDVAYVLVSWGE